MQGQTGPFAGCPPRSRWAAQMDGCSTTESGLSTCYGKAPLRRGFSMWYAGHVQPLGGASPLWRLMAPTTSRSQLRRCEAGWEGRRRRNRDPRDTNRIRGGAARASQHDMAKPDVIKGPSRKCGGCARKVAGLIPGDLLGCRRMPVQRVGADRRVGATAAAGRLPLAGEKSAEAVVPAGSLVAGKGRTRSRA